MEKIRLGRTGLMVSRSGFGAIPIQRISAGKQAACSGRPARTGSTFRHGAQLYGQRGEDRPGLGRRPGEISSPRKARGSCKRVLEELERASASLGLRGPTQIHNLKKALDPDVPDSPYQGLLRPGKRG